MNKYQICTRCVMDTTDPAIVFDSDGVCNHCKNAEKLLKSEPYFLSKEEKTKQFTKIVSEIKSDGKRKKYDCIIGVSGGVDSTYVAYLVNDLGLRPLAVHLDNGWNSELANANIEKTCQKLGIELFTYVMDWEEFKNIQISFVKGSTPDWEIPTDHAIVSILYKMANKLGIKYIIGGTNLSSESIMPQAWSQGHGDWIYINSVYKTFFTKKIISYPHRSMYLDLYFRYIKKINWLSILDYYDYDKETAKLFLINNLEWKDYGGKHYESLYTKIYQTYFLPVKFGFDKRKAHYSSLIIAGQISREKALEALKKSSYDESTIKNDLRYFMNKLDILEIELENIMKEKPKTINDYMCFKKTFFYKILEYLKTWRKAK